MIGAPSCRKKADLINAIAERLGRVIERRRAEEALRESEARYKALFAGAPEGMLVADLQTKQFRHANPAICRMFGYSEEEFLRLGVADIHPKESLSYVLAEFEALARGEKLSSTDLPCRRKDGSLFYASVNAIMVALGGHRCVVGFFSDVTERKKTDEALRRRAAELEDLNQQLTRAHDEASKARVALAEKSSLLQSVAEALVVPLSEQLQGTASTVFSRLAGIVPADAFALAIVSDDQPLILAFAPAGLSRRVTDEIRRRMREAAEIALGRKLPRTIPLGLEPITNGSANVESIRSHAILPLTSSDLETQILGGMFSAKADAFEDDHVALFSAAGVSLASLYLARIVHAKEEELQRRQSEFVATVSHELRTPIHSIWGFVKLLLAGKAQDEECPHRVPGDNRPRVRAPGRARGRLLDVSKIEAGRVEMRREPLSFEEVATRTVAAFKTLADEKALTIDTDLPADLPSVEGDTERLGQVLANLVSNAIKFSEADGRIIVRAGVEGTELVVSVQDQGIGVAPEALPHLFERFYQADDSSTRWQGGTGLGLSISRQIVEAHGGRMWVDSNVGEGSTFTFAIPIATLHNENIRTDEAA